MENTDKYIWRIDEGDDVEPDKLPPGWYFQNEVEQLEGPYSSRQEALDALEGYSKWLNGEVDRENEHKFND